MSHVKQFHDEMSDNLTRKGLRIGPWVDATKRSSHLLLIESCPKKVILYIKESNKDPGFWGLTKNQISAIISSELRWFVVLLLRSHKTGYLLSGGQVNIRIEDGRFELGSDGDFKVNEKADLAEGQLFQNISELIERVL